MKVRMRKWGNSWAVRLGRKDLEALGIEPRDGKTLDIQLQEKEEKWDVSMLPVFNSGRTQTLDEIRNEWAAARVKELHARR